jgi:ABC-type sugar transport system ATPase subunit
MAAIVPAPTLFSLTEKAAALTAKLQNAAEVRIAGLEAQLQATHKQRAA